MRDRGVGSHGVRGDVLAVTGRLACCSRPSDRDWPDTVGLATIQARRAAVGLGLVGLLAEESTIRQLGLAGG